MPKPRPKKTKAHRESPPKERKPKALAPHDEFFKETFGMEPIARQYLQAYIPLELRAHLDLGHLRPDQNSYVTGHLSRSMSDVVWSGSFANGGPEFKISFLFEHKSSPAEHPHLQLLEYWLGIQKAALKATEEPPFVLPIIVYHGEEQWHVRGLHEYYPGLPAAFHRFVPHFDYLLTDLGRCPEAELLAKGDGGLYNIFMALLHARDKAYVRENFHVFIRGLPPALFKNLFHAILVYTFKSTNYTQEEINQILSDADTKNQDSNIMTTYEATFGLARREGREEGINLGIEKGRQEGINLGINLGIEKGIEKGIRVLLRTTSMSLPEIAAELECGLDLVIKVNNELKAR